MNKTIKRIGVSCIVIIMILASIIGALAEDNMGSSKVKINIYNGSFKLTDKNNNFNEWDCDSNQELTYYYPATCPIPTCHCNATCPKDIITLNATCNKECPSIPVQNISCNQECAECPEDDNSAFWVAFFFLIMIAGTFTYLYLKELNKKPKPKQPRQITPVAPILPQPIIKQTQQKEFMELN